MQVVQFGHYLPGGFLFACAGVPQFEIGIFEVLRKFFAKVRIGRGFQSQGSDTVSNQLLKVRHVQFLSLG
jgi:hypothetical protein